MDLNKTNNVTYSHKSMIDDFGRIFFYDNRVFREIAKGKESFCLELLNSNLFKELIEKKLIPLTYVSHEFDEESLILEHKKLLESLQHEWTFEMFKDASLMVLEVNEICNKYGYELKDAHTLNVLFDNNKPVFVDLGSIDLIRSMDSWVAYEEFLNSFFIPLIFWSKNELFIVRKLLESNFHRMFTIPSQNFEQTGLYKLLGLKYSLYEFSFRKKKLFASNKKKSIISFIEKVLNKVVKIVFNKKNKLFKYELKVNRITNIFLKHDIKEKIKLLQKTNENSQWKGYHGKFYNNIESINYSYRFKRLLEIIKDLKDVQSAIDLAGNEGYFSILMSKEMSLKKIILVDYDENAINTAYLNIKELNIGNITPLLLNFMFTPDLLGTSKRLRSDIVIALAVTHHLLLTANFSLAAIFERLVMFSNKYVVVEFMPLGLWSIETKIQQDLPEGYTVEWFGNEFSKYFDLIIEEQLEENRIVFVGKIIE